ncbi:Organic hydroperoxide resistance transcriptional regulator [Aliarcobacter thereius]|uniref:HTH-type transcriptional regulator SarZ n=2 Tax=Aliarcobacter thereius TaxID=544718 RepID=A0A1C0B658_9BACT|nr:MarR family transcriptional regulator [Aliarcobacter thereius]OCL86323.1 Organic hydroperoxide resistance transcriptional regulator [Aliarcobacter thereius]OCL90007.1 Organic hydroperoxide resistance transcriptional regulator [Aliarcobacter thereius]OCL96393.1 Organic hydroperoxide resistance transcriptional regulator [Aliarcobacter thereius LMG 24486]OCL98646.1 Organic hydroperoxide resistance transcriptional regulator [Aliarcobacter thereius]QBF15646.1 transcriptional regulator, MarR fami
MNRKYIEDFYKRVEEENSRKIYSLFLPMLLLTKQTYYNGESHYKENYDLLNSEVDVLAALYFNSEDHTLSPTELYSAIIFSSGGMTKVLKKLEERKLIKRISCQKDKRKVLVSLTKDGEEVVLSCVETTAKRLEDVYSILDEKERVFLKDILKKLIFSNL